MRRKERERKSDHGKGGKEIEQKERYVNQSRTPIEARRNKEGPAGGLRGGDEKKEKKKEEM